MIQRTSNPPSVRANWRRPPPLTDHFAALVQRLNLSKQDGDSAPRMVGVTSWIHGAGVSTVAVNLAIGAALRRSQPVLLVDAHLERPSIAKLLRLKPQAGVAEWMAGAADVDEIIQRTDCQNLSVVSAGVMRRNTVANDDVSRWSLLIDELQARFPLLIWDLPIAHASSTGLALSTLLDGILFVVDARQGHRQEAVRAQRQLIATGARLLGVVLNKQ